jgi:hypothetical protein
VKTSPTKLGLLLCAIDLSGCRFRDQGAFGHRVQSEVAVGMPVQVAIARLSDMQLNCTRANPADCWRVRQEPMPNSCVERIRLYWMEQTRRITRIEIPELACAAL